MSLIISGSGLGGPYMADMPVQPSPCFETSSPCEPSLILGTLAAIFASLVPIEIEFFSICSAITKDNVHAILVTE
ncbi:hypothetical protein CDL12_19749 [Handroanthus impetiginosus]|uniref:Uncharacterized protein n=1 Tax=Handroanthus impetiginosus TaxID=429701 RepID=A0A2G9GQV1_9LAMI|nr:hypothetical protein CDL12_19749 [Handroanthus impetiginosus]